MNENQEIVLNWLKKQGRNYPIFNLADLHRSNFKELQKAYNNLTDEEEFKVLQAFAEWGLSKED